MKQNDELKETTQEFEVTEDLVPNLDEELKDIYSKKLNEQQKIFCDTYIKTLNASASYKTAYPSKKQRTNESGGSRLLQQPHIRAFIESRLKELEDVRIADAKEVLEFLTEGLRGELKDEVVASETDMESGMTKPVTIWKQISVKERIKCAELLGKRFDLFTEKVESTSKMEITIVDDI